MVFERPFTTPNKDNPDGLNPRIPVPPRKDKPLLAWITSNTDNKCLSLRKSEIGFLIPKKDFAFLF